MQYSCRFEPTVLGPLCECGDGKSSRVHMRQCSVEDSSANLLVALPRPRPRAFSSARGAAAPGFVDKAPQGGAHNATPSRGHEGVGCVELAGEDAEGVEG